MGVETAGLHRTRCFESEQATADDHRATSVRGVRQDGVDIVDGAVDEDAALVDVGHGRHEGRRAGGQHQRLVRIGSTVGIKHLPGGAIDGHDGAAGVKLDASFAVPFGAGERELLRRAIGEVVGQVDPIVRGTRFFPEDRHPTFAAHVAGDQLLAEAMADHSVADHEHMARRQAFSRVDPDGMREHRPSASMD